TPIRRATPARCCALGVRGCGAGNVAVPDPEAHVVPGLVPWQVRSSRHPLTKGTRPATPNLPGGSRLDAHRDRVDADHVQQGSTDVTFGVDRDAVGPRVGLDHRVRIIAGQLVQERRRLGFGLTWDQYDLAGGTQRTCVDLV